MKKILITVLFTALAIAGAQAQSKYFTKSGTITFYSKAALEDIEAKNQKATCVIDAAPTSPCTP